MDFKKESFASLVGVRLVARILSHSTPKSDLRAVLHSARVRHSQLHSEIHHITHTMRKLFERDLILHYQPAKERIHTAKSQQTLLNRQLNTKIADIDRDFGVKSVFLEKESQEEEVKNLEKHYETLKLRVFALKSVINQQAEIVNSLKNDLKAILRENVTISQTLETISMANLRILPKKNAHNRWVSSTFFDKTQENSAKMEIKEIKSTFRRISRLNSREIEKKRDWEGFFQKCFESCIKEFRRSQLNRHKSPSLSLYFESIKSLSPENRLVTESTDYTKDLISRSFRPISGLDMLKILSVSEELREKVRKMMFPGGCVSPIPVVSGRNRGLTR